MSDLLDEYLVDAERRMKQAVAHLDHELQGARTGRASPTLVENLSIDYYGQPTPLKQIAGISAPELRLLVIQPWDKAAVPDIERAILKSDLGITPSNDGSVIHLPIPPLSEDRRRDLVKVMRGKVEEARIAVRNVRRDVHDDLRELIREKESSEDAVHRAEQRLQDLTDASITDIDLAGNRKETEVMTV
jgi:ribosome recycling factor